MSAGSCTSCCCNAHAQTLTTSPQALNPAACLCCHCLLQFFVNEMTYPQGGQDGKPKRGYQASPEDAYYNLAQYYDLPTISFR